MLTLAATLLLTANNPFLDRVEHDFADHNGVNIHYAHLGEGPLVVMLHGFPDYWYTWRHQMEELAKDHLAVALDLRGYNESDQPEGVANYAMPLLIGDVVAVVEHLGYEKATVVGHDWGGAIAWQVAMSRPDIVERLIILNLPHPNGLARELAGNQQQQDNSQYARDFQAEGAHNNLSAAGLAGWVTDAEARRHYVKAFERSSFEGMLNYYKANYPRGNSGGGGGAVASSAALPRVQAPVLMFHGLDDQALLPGGLNDTWEWLDRDLTLVTVPGAGHFVQQDARDLVTRYMRAWVDLHPLESDSSSPAGGSSSSGGSR